MAQYQFDINAAMKAGYTPDQIQQYLSQQQKQGDNYQLTPTPQATPQQSQQPAQPKSNFLADMLPTAGSIVGGIGGALIPGLGETGIGEIGGSAAGGAAGEGLKELIEGKPLSSQDIATQGVLGGVGGAVGKGISAVAGKVLPNIAEGTAGKLMNMVYKQPGKAAKAAIAGGETLGEQALNRGQVGTTQGLLDAANTQIANKENALQNILMNSNATVSMDDVRKTAQPLIDKYTQAGNTTAADALKQRLAAIEAANGTQVPAAAANQIKRSLYDEVNKAYGTQASSNTEGTKAVARGLKEALDPIPGVSQVNKDLSFYGQQRQAMIDKLAADQKKGLVRLGDIPAVGAALVPGGLPAAAAYELVGRVGSTTLAKTAGAQALNTLANSPAAAFAGNVAAKSIGQGVARGSLPSSPGVLNEQANQASNNNSDNNNPNQNTLPPSPSQAFGDNSTIQPQNSQTLSATPTGGVASTPLAGYKVNGQPIDPATANLIQKIASYQIDPTKMTSLKNNERERLINLVSQYDPTYDSTQFPVKQKLRDDYTSGTTGKNIQAFNTAIQHLNLLSQVSQGLGNTSFTPYNAFKNNISQMTGSPKTTNFNQVANAVSGEIAKIFKSSGATDAEITNIQKGLGSDMSPEQLQGNIKYLISLMGGKLNALNSQYSQAMGKPADFQIVDPKSQQILQSLQADPNQLPATP